MGYGRSEATLKQWLDTLTPKEKKGIQLFAMDMHEAFKNAVINDKQLAHVAIVHDPFHVIKRANEAIDELRRSIFFRAGPDMRALGRGTRWLFLRAWERCTEQQQAKLQQLLACNSKLAAAYQMKEELREVLAAPDEAAMAKGLAHVLRRTQRKANVPLRKLHDSLVNHRPQILAFGKYRPPVGRIEALNNNWETLVRRGPWLPRPPVPASQAPLPDGQPAPDRRWRPCLPGPGRLSAPVLTAKRDNGPFEAPRWLDPHAASFESARPREGVEARPRSLSWATRQQRA